MILKELLKRWLYSRKKEILCPRFIVIGDGEKLEELKELAKQKNVDAYFTGRLEYKKMCALLCQCDMVVNPIVGSSVEYN